MIWLRWEPHLPRDGWFDERQGRLIDATVEQSTTPHGELTESVVLESDSGLAVALVTDWIGQQAWADQQRIVVVGASLGAREDERTPAGQAERLYELAGEPKRLRFTDGAHIEPDRVEIIAELLAMADEEMAFLTNAQAP